MVKLKYKILGLIGLGTTGLIITKTLTTDNMVAEVETFGKDLMKPLEQALPKNMFRIPKNLSFSKTSLAKMQLSGPYFGGTIGSTASSNYRIPSFKLPSKRSSSKVKLPW